uniref:MUM1-like PWWP domain-containing protein n=1 Tax=Ciona savignyi TaxID=51511 RepID=H2YAX4_CIOSA
MIKRKWANSDKISNKRRKTINLPDLDVSDFVFHETTNSNSFNDFPMKFEPKVESDDEDLPEAILNSGHNDERIKKGDILWVKHNAKYCYWPAYVKAVMGQKVSIYYISFHKFTQGEKALKFNLRSKKIKRFNCKEHKSLLEAGRKHCEEVWK